MNSNELAYFMNGVNVAEHCKKIHLMFFYKKKKASFQKLGKCLHLNEDCNIPDSNTMTQHSWK